MFGGASPPTQGIDPKRFFFYGCLREAGGLVNTAAQGNRGMGESYASVNRVRICQQAMVRIAVERINYIMLDWHDQAVTQA